MFDQRTRVCEASFSVGSSIEWSFNEGAPSHQNRAAMGAFALFSFIVIMTPARGLAAHQEVQTGPKDTPCPTEAVTISPGQSIQAVVNDEPIGAAICLKSGVHRSRSIRPKHGQRFFGEPRAILNGTVIIDKFTADGTHWTAVWPAALFRRYGKCIEDSPQCNFPEAVFIDDKPLVQALSRDAVAPGRFYIDYNTRRLFLGNDPSNHKIEVTAVDFAIKGPAKNVVIENLIVEKYASPAQHGAIYAAYGSSGWTIRNCEVRLNSGAGIEVSGGGIVEGSSVHHNGQTGIVGTKNNIRIQGNDIWANNIYGYDYGWEAGGIKIARSQFVTFHANHVYDNVGPGIWCDIDCRDVVYTENSVENNHDAGIFFEISYGATIRNNTLRRNGIGRRDWFWGADIQIAGSEDVLIENNHLTVGEGGCGIMLIDQGRQNEKGGTYKTQNVRAYRNQMTFDGPPCAGGVTDADPGDSNYRIISSGGNEFDNNVYYVSLNSGPSRFIWGHRTKSWSAFQGAGQERRGRLSTLRKP